MPYSVKGFFEIEINEDMKILLMLEVLFTQDSCKFVWSFYTNSLLVPEKRGLNTGGKRECGFVERAESRSTSANVIGSAETVS